MLIVGLSCFAAMLTLFFFGFEVYEETERLEYAAPIWLLGIGFGWETFEETLRPLTPW